MEKMQKNKTKQTKTKQLKTKRQKRTTKIFLHSNSILTEIRGGIVSIKTGWYEEKKKQPQNKKEPLKIYIYSLSRRYTVM